MSVTPSPYHPEMAATVELAGIGVPSSAGLVRFIAREQDGDPLRPITVVARSTLASLDLRRRLAWQGMPPREDPRNGREGNRRAPARRPGLVGVRVILLRRLAELLGSPELSGRGDGGGPTRPLTEVALGAAIRLALDESPGSFAPVAAHSATEAALRHSYRELRRVDDRDVATLRGFGSPLAEVCDLTRRARAATAAMFYDDEDLELAAAQAVRTSRASLEDVGAIALYLPDTVSPGARLFLQALAGRVPVAVFLGMTGDPGPDGRVTELAAELAEALDAPLLEATRDRGHLPSLVPASDEADAGVSAQAHSRAAEPARPAEPANPVGLPSPADPVLFNLVIEAPDPESEVREAIRLVLVHDPSGSRLSRCAITYGTGPRYARLIPEMLARAGICWNGTSISTIAELADCRVIQGLVDLASSPVELGRAAVIAWLGTGPTVDRESGYAPVGQWDRWSREAGVVAGRDEWRRLLTRFADRVCEARPATAAGVADLERFMADLADHADALRACRTWEAFSQWLGLSIQRYTAHAPDEARSSLELARDELGELDVIEPLGGHDTDDRLRRMKTALSTSLARPVSRVGQFGTGVIVGSLDALAGVDLDLVVVLGVAEGDLPRHSAEDPFLHRREREHLGIAGLPIERPDERDRRLLAGVLAGALQKVATVARRDPRVARAIVASRWLEGDLASRARRLSIGSFAESLRSVSVAPRTALDSVEYELASLRSFGEAGHRYPEHFLVRSEPLVAAALEVVAARASGHLSRFTGLAGLGLTSESDRPVLSATTLEDFAGCPFKGFLRHRLHVEVVQAPERRIEIDPRDRGSLIHEVLERLVQEVLGSRMPWGGWHRAELERARVIATEVCRRYELSGLTGRSAFWTIDRRRLIEDLERFLEADSAICAEAGRVPVATEWTFGDGEIPALSVKVSGAPVRLRGRIDRVDRHEDGALTVVDYKSGSGTDFAELAEDPVARGERLQLAIYALAAEEHFGSEHGRPGSDNAASDAREDTGAREDAGAANDPDGPTQWDSSGGVRVRAEYRFVSGSDPAARVSVAADAMTRSRLKEVLTTLHGLLDSGTFPARPGVDDRGKPKQCRRCDYDGLCCADRTAAWARVRTDQRILGYAEMAEPDPDRGKS